MKAFVVDKYGRDVRAPPTCPSPPGRADVLVAVPPRASTRWTPRSGNGEFKLSCPYKTPFVLGHDLAGVVTASASAVRRFDLG